VMDHGRIVERGTHTELLAAEGAYSRLYHAQFERPAGSEESGEEEDAEPEVIIAAPAAA